MKLTKVPLKYYTFLGIVGTVISLFISNVYINLFGFSGNWLIYYIMICIPIIFYILFFMGYFIKQKSWTLMKRLLPYSIICCAVQIVFFIFMGTFNIYSGNIWVILIDIISSAKWIPFCVSLFLYKDIAKNIKWVSLIFAIFEALRIILFGVRFSHGFTNIITNAFLLILLISMFVLQHKNSKKTEGIQNGVQ